MNKKTVAEMQKILDDARNEDAPPFTVIDENTIQTIVDDEIETFTRDDVYSGHPLSGYAHYGSVGGDHRMIRAIYDDMQTAFKLIDEEEGTE